jgi:prepilin-type N-terminal cleavage/methylation domain-containing protein
MRATRKAAAALRREERGFTLIELLVATLVGLVVVGGALTVFVSGIRSEPRAAAKVEAIQQARVTVDRITRELRQGWETPTTSSNQLAIVTYVKVATCGGGAASTAIPCRVTYTCTAGACTRTVAQPDGTAPGPAVHVGVAFAFDSGGAEPVTLGDGVALRNAEAEEV